MSIFITGGTGLVGSHVAEEAVKRGLHVKALARQGSDTKFLEHLGVEIVKGDLADAQSLELGVANCELVINCAAKVGDWGTLEEFRALNVVALEKLLDAMVAAKTKRFVHVSSLGVYEGRDHFGTDETTQTFTPAENSERTMDRVEPGVESRPRQGVETRDILRRKTDVRPAGECRLIRW